MASFHGAADARKRPALPRSVTTVIFDLDGTLIDSVPDLAAAANRLLDRLGRPALDLAAARGFVGDGARVFVEKALKATGGIPADLGLDGALALFLADYEEHAADLTRPYPEVPETLAALRAAGKRLAICTNKPIAATRRVLDALDLARHFAEIAGGDSFPVRKPDPGHVRLLLDRLGAEAADACMVGDNEHDSHAAGGAGLPFILMGYGYARLPLGEIPAARRLDRFAELPDAIASLA